MRIRNFLKGEALQGSVVRFCNDFREDGKKAAVRFDGEFLARKTTGFVRNDDPFLIGVYDPKHETFDLESMVGDILCAMDEMGVRVEQEKV